MITKEDLNDLIPHGKRRIIAEKAGVSPGAVTKYFTDKIKSSFKIQKAALEVALECNTEITQMEKRLEKLNN